MNRQDIDEFVDSDFAFPPVEDAACGEAARNKFISDLQFKGFLAISDRETRVLKSLKNMVR